MTVYDIYKISSVCIFVVTKDGSREYTGDDEYKNSIVTGISPRHNKNRDYSDFLMLYID